MGLSRLGDKFGDAALRGVQGYFDGVRIYDARQDRADRKQRMAQDRTYRDTQRERNDEQYQYGLTRRGINEEIQNNQLERSRMETGKARDADEFRRTVQKDGVAALRGFEAGDVNLAGEFYNKYVPDGKTGQFTKDADGTFRHDYVDDITGEAGTEVFDQNQMQSVLQRAVTSDDEFLDQLKSMGSETAKWKAERDKFTYEENLKQKGRVELQGLTDEGKGKAGSEKADQVIGVRGNLLSRSQIANDYKSENIIQGEWGQESLRKNAPGFREYFNARVQEEDWLPKTYQKPAEDINTPLSQTELERAEVQFNTAGGADKANDWKPFNQATDDQIKALAYKNREAQQPASRGLTQRTPEPRQSQGPSQAKPQKIDRNMARAMEAIQNGKDREQVIKRMIDAGYTPEQLQAAGL